MSSSVFKLLVVVAIIGSATAADLSPSLVASHSFKAPFASEVPGFRIGGDANVMHDFVRLTPAVQSKRGNIWSTTPVATKSFRTEIQARVTGSGNIGGDGWAFWMTEEAPWQKPDDKYDLFGGPSDTFDNDNRGNNPYIAVFVGNGDGSFVPGTDGGDQEIGGCRVSYRNSISHYTTRITKIDDSLTVEYDMTGAGSWVTCVQVSRPGVLNAGQYYIGTSAETGGLADNHDIKSLEFFNMVPSPIPVQPPAPAQPTPPISQETAPATPVLQQPPAVVEPPVVVQQPAQVSQPVQQATAPAASVIATSDEILDKLKALITEFAEKKGITQATLDTAAVEARQSALKNYVKTCQELESQLQQLSKEASTQAELLENIVNPSKGGQIGKLSTLLSELDAKTQEVMRSSFDASRKDKSFGRDLGHEFEGLKRASQMSSSWTMVIIGLFVGTAIGCVIVWRHHKKAEMSWLEQ